MDNEMETGIVEGGLWVLLSKLLVSPFIIPIVVPYTTPPLRSLDPKP